MWVQLKSTKEVTEEFLNQKTYLLFCHWNFWDQVFLQNKSLAIRVRVNNQIFLLVYGNIIDLFSLKVCSRQHQHDGHFSHEFPAAHITWLRFRRICGLMKCWKTVTWSTRQEVFTLWTFSWNHKNLSQNSSTLKIYLFIFFFLTCCMLFVKSGVSLVYTRRNSLWA